MWWWWVKMYRLENEQCSCAFSSVELCAVGTMRHIQIKRQFFRCFTDSFIILQIFKRNCKTYHFCGTNITARVHMGVLSMCETLMQTKGNFVHISRKYPQNRLSFQNCSTFDHSGQSEQSIGWNIHKRSFEIKIQNKINIDTFEHNVACSISQVGYVSIHLSNNLPCLFIITHSWMYAVYALFILNGLCCYIYELLEQNGRHEQKVNEIKNRADFVWRSCKEQAHNGQGNGNNNSWANWLVMRVR